MVKYLIISLCCIAFVSSAQDVTFSGTKKLSPLINSNCEEIFPLLSPDQQALYFVRSSCYDNTGGKFAGTDIWVSHFDVNTKQWSKPSNEKNIFNDKSNNALIGISSNGGVLYQLNTNSSEDTPGIYFSKRLGNEWTQPELVPLPYLKTDGFLGLYVSPDFNVILISMKNSSGMGQEDLFVSLKNSSSTWSTPRNLGSVINTEGFEISPFLTADKKRLYFTSSGHWGMGEGDIFYSDRLDDSWDNWSTPVNLGSEVNSKNFDAYFSVYDSLAYFSSNRGGSYSDLYVTSVKIAEDSSQLEIDRIVSEAKQLLNDLGDDTTDSLGTDLKPIFIGFENNSVQMDDQAIAKLNSVVSRVKNQKANKRTIKLVAYSNNTELQGDKLSYQRLEAVRNYLQDTPLPNLTVKIELKKPLNGEQSARNGLVEVRYEY
jgi:outer membrane protein OmpA-like peptidoglycan-associated protein